MLLYWACGGTNETLCGTCITIKIFLQILVMCSLMIHNDTRRQWNFIFESVAESRLCSTKRAISSSSKQIISYSHVLAAMGNGKNEALALDVSKDRFFVCARERERTLVERLSIDWWRSIDARDDAYRRGEEINPLERVLDTSDTESKFDISLNFHIPQCSVSLILIFHCHDYNHVIEYQLAQAACSCQYSTRL